MAWLHFGNPSVGKQVAVGTDGLLGGRRTLNRWAVVIMNEMRPPDVLILAWEVEGLVVSCIDDFTDMKNSSANLVLHVLNSARVVRKHRYAHCFLQCKTLSSLPDSPLSLKEAADL